MTISLKGFDTQMTNNFPRTVKIIACTLAFLILPSFAFAKALTVYPIDNLPTLVKNKGYALFYVNSEIDSASFNLSQISSKYINPRSRAWDTVYKSQKYTVSLKGLPKGFYVLLLERGIYQITQVNSPYYDLPFRYQTKDDVRWQFNVDNKHLNYVGHINFEKERSTDTISVGLHNRIAMDYEQIMSLLASLEKPPKFRLGTGVKDDFFAEINGEKK